VYLNAFLDITAFSTVKLHCYPIKNSPQCKRSSL